MKVFTHITMVEKYANNAWDFIFSVLIVQLYMIEMTLNIMMLAGFVQNI